MREGFELEEGSEISWREFLTDFEEQIWPIFEVKGYTKDTALMVWTMNKVYNSTEYLAEVLRDGE